jgi:hypothetical protein
MMRRYAFNLGGFMNPKQIEAAAEFNRGLISKLANEKGVHAETAISAASRMAGTFILRSTGLPLGNLKPGSPVFSDLANDQGQQVLALADQTLASLGVRIDARKVDYDLSPEHEPHMNLMEMQSLLDPGFRAIAVEFGLTEAQAAGSLAISAAILIQQCAGFLDPHVAYAVAVYGMVEGSKTVPFDATASRETAA